MWKRAEKRERCQSILNSTKPYFGFVTCIFAKRVPSTCTIYFLIVVESNFLFVLKEQ